MSEAGPFTTMRPRTAPSGSEYEGQDLVWAVDDVHLPDYFLPRECPRVCWATATDCTGWLASPAPRVIAIEHGWFPRLIDAHLHVHDLDPAGFTQIDSVAGYWVNPHAVQVRTVRHVEDCVTAIANAGVELRLTASLWPYVDAVTDSPAEFSVIRIRNARPRPPA